MAGRDPLVSVVLTTRDRPRFLPLALAWYASQTYSERELIVVDDGEHSPADPALIADHGGRLLRVDPGTPLGTKLNRGLEVARGRLCQKWDDDDWYGPRFLESMVDALLESWRAACRPTLAYLTPFLFFDLARWEVRRSVDNNVPGASFHFSRDAWEERSFRALPGDEDVWFLLDQVRLGTELLPVAATEQFMAVRHSGLAGDRGHTWVHQWSGETLERYLLDREQLVGGPEPLLPAWAIEAYRELRRQLVAEATARGAAPA